jgi:hypothetical protein
LFCLKTDFLLEKIPFGKPGQWFYLHLKMKTKERLLTVWFSFYKNIGMSEENIKKKRKTAEGWDDGRLVIVCMEDPRVCICDKCQEIRHSLEEVEELGPCFFDFCDAQESISNRNDQNYREQGSSAFAASCNIPLVTPQKSKNSNPMKSGVFDLRTFGKPSQIGAVLKREINEVALHMNMVEANYHGKISLDFAGTRSFLGADYSADLNLYEMNGIDMTGAMTSINNIFSPIIQASFMNPMNDIGVYKLSTAADYAPRHENSDQLRSIEVNHHGCFFFTPLMLLNKELSLLNPKNQPEFFEENGGKIVG